IITTMPMASKATAAAARISFLFFRMMCVPPQKMAGQCRRQGPAAEKYKSSEPIPYREQVRIVWVWLTPAKPLSAVLRAQQSRSRVETKKFLPEYSFRRSRKPNGGRNF
ncbi:MAG: hypothetical protein K1W21_11635, partial [Oscillospiraceae bacterium]